MSRESSGLAEAVGELANYPSVDTETGRQQEWRPILEGELAKAKTIQTEATGLHHREIEQAVIAVFLSSQPIGQKALTPELSRADRWRQSGPDRTGEGAASMDGVVLVPGRGGSGDRRSEPGRHPPVAQGVAVG